MSGRPTDWSPLTGSVSDPVPGDPDEIERAARSLVDVAEEITRQTANLRKLSTAEGWDADAGRTFADSARDLAGQLDKAHGRYATAGGALKRYAPELRHAQSMADTALTEAKAAQTTINANQPPVHLPAGPPTPDETTAERHRQYAHDDGISALQAARRKLDEATQHRDEQAGRAARVISDSIDHDGLADSWWDKFTNWVHEHADILKAIAKIAEMVATVLSTIALAISWIPVLDFLSPALLGLAALASGVALVCNLMLALAGGGSWLDVAVDLFAVVSFGYGAYAARAAGAGIKAIPQGFKDVGEFEQFGSRLSDGLTEAGFSDTRAVFQGSSVTGKSFRTGEAFDAGRTSDYDIALGGDRIFGAAKDAGVGLRSGGIRTGPLRPVQLERLGLTELRADLSESAGRPVNFMIYHSIEDALERSPSIEVARP